MGEKKTKTYFFPHGLGKHNTPTMEVIRFLENKLRRYIDPSRLKIIPGDDNFWFEQGTQFLEPGDYVEYFDYDGYDFLILYAPDGKRTFFARDEGGYFVPQE